MDSVYPCSSLESFAERPSSISKGYDVTGGKTAHRKNRLSSGTDGWLMRGEADSEFESKEQSGRQKT